jgi:rare lipoprotein A (peptidoglycan hydrolase)
VTNRKNNNSVVVKVTYRMHPRSKSIIDVSMKAAEELDMLHDGQVRVRVEPAESKFSTKEVLRMLLTAGTSSLR